MTSDKPMRVKEFSEKYGIHPNIIYKHIQDGTLPAHKIAGVIMLFESEIMQATKVKGGQNDD